MKKNKIKRIVFLLDETGSMEVSKNDTIGGFNTFLENMKKRDEDKKFTFVLFNSNKIEIRNKNEPLKKIEKLNTENYNPSYSTPLYDAIGLTIKKMKEKKNILFVILTDGEENSSNKYSLKYVKEKIKEKEDKYNWKFLFLGVDISEFEGQKMGIKNVEIYGMKEVKTLFNKLSEKVEKHTNADR